MLGTTLMHSRYAHATHAIYPTHYATIFTHGNHPVHRVSAQALNIGS